MVLGRDVPDDVIVSDSREGTAALDSFLRGETDMCAEPEETWVGPGDLVAVGGTDGVCAVRLGSVGREETEVAEDSAVEREPLERACRSERILLLLALEGTESAAERVEENEPLGLRSVGLEFVVGKPESAGEDEVGRRKRSMIQTGGGILHSRDACSYCTPFGTAMRCGGTMVRQRKTGLR